MRLAGEIITLNRSLPGADAGLWISTGRPAAGTCRVRVGIDGIGYRETKNRCHRFWSGVDGSHISVRFELSDAWTDNEKWVPKHRLLIDAEKMFSGNICERSGISVIESGSAFRSQLTVDSKASPSDWFLHFDFSFFRSRARCDCSDSERATRFGESSSAEYES